MICYLVPNLLEMNFRGPDSWDEIEALQANSTTHGYLPLNFFCHGLLFWPLNYQV